MGEDVVVLTGGTGGAKLARGMADVVGPERLAAIVNTGDDIEIYGAHVSPDPDLVSFWLADAIDERGWGLRGDTLRGDGRAARARRGGVVQPRRPRPRVVPGARADARRGTLPDGGARAPERGDRRAHAGAADERRSRAHLGPHGLAGWRAFQEFMIRERAAGTRSRGWSTAAPSRRGRARRRSPRSRAPARS